MSISWFMKSDKQLSNIITNFYGVFHCVGDELLTMKTWKIFLNPKLLIWNKKAHKLTIVSACSSFKGTNIICVYFSI